VADITGKKMSTVEYVVAAPRCSRNEGGVRRELAYQGYESCEAANLAFGGPQACKYACIGLGDCARVCPFGAITMVDNMPVVDPDTCVGCGTCVEACPKGLMELIPEKARVWVPCNSREGGKAVKQVCSVGCISCKLCVKACPAEAVTLEDNRIKIDHKKCIDYGPECGETCVEKCPQNIFRRFLPREQKQQLKSAA